VQQLWEALPAWEQLGSEVILGGYPVPDWIRAQALEKIVPEDMLRTIIGRPELAEYSAKYTWVRSQMEHARGATQAGWVSGAPPRAKHKDMEVGEVAYEKESCASTVAGTEGNLIWSLQAELSRSAAAGDWDAAGAISGALYA
jgi:hypothetical protein